MKKVWKHKKYKSEFFGSYERNKKGERVFNLVSGNKQVTFESPQQAKKLGWECISNKK